MISTRRKEAELQYINARQNYTLALQKLNILMGEEPNAPVDSLCAIGVVCPPVTLLPLMMCCNAGPISPAQKSTYRRAKPNEKQP